MWVDKKGQRRALLKSPLYHLTSGPAALRAVRITLAARVSI